jgi:DNA-binding HxlR family transcriptional regulator
VPSASGSDPLAGLIDALGRRGALEVFRALEGGPLGARALQQRLAGLPGSLVTQRAAELRRLGAVEVVPESGELRLSPSGRRLQDLLLHLAGWAERGR